MADLDKVKRNVAKMVSMNAPESDIDQYISGEGVTVEQIKNHKVNTAPSNARPMSHLQSKFPEVYNPLVDLKYNAPAMLKRGSTVGGLANAGNAELGFVTSPISIADRKIRETGSAIENMLPPFVQKGTTETVMDLVGAIPRLGGYAGQKLTEAGIGLAGGVLGHNLGTTPQNAMDIYREVPKLGSTVGSIALSKPIAEGVSKTAPFIRQGVDATGKAMEARNTKIVGKEIRTLAPPSTAPSKATIAKNYDSRIAEAIPEIQKDIKAVGGRVIDTKIETPKVEQLTDFVGKTKQRIWKEVTEKTDAIKDNSFDTKLSKDKVLQDIKDNLTDFQDADLVSTEKFLSTYDKPTTIGGVSKEISRLNRETQAYEYANDVKKHEMRVVDPLLDAKIKLRDQLREDYLNEVDASGISGVPELRKKYGAVAEVHKNLLGNLERNKNLDKKGGFFGVFKGTPMAISLISGVITKLATDNPALLGVEGLAGGAAMYNKYRQKPSPTANRVVKRLQ